MFVSALVADSQHHYDAVMKQAIGRCDRSGQDQEVHVYHFMLAKTLEVNIWQARQGKKVVRENGVFMAITPDGKPGGWEGPGLERAACGARGIVISDEEGVGEDAGEDAGDPMQVG
jgi:hypothetical protein